MKKSLTDFLSFLDKAQKARPSYITHIWLEDEEAYCKRDFILELCKSNINTWEVRENKIGVEVNGYFLYTHLDENIEKHKELCRLHAEEVSEK